MRNYLTVAVAMMLAVLGATSLYSNAEDTVPPRAEQPSDRTGPQGAGGEPTMTVFDHHEVQGILGREVRSSTDENMGRIVDVVVDRTSGQVKAAIIDFGGFLGVGSRKIAVAWNALHFSSNEKSNEKKPEKVALELTRDQVRASPEYKEDRPVVVLGASGGLESLAE
jgi:sporulation protein YlmC with PRC-barrel domain